MATTTGYIDYTEQTEPAAPSATHQRVYIDSTSHRLKRTDSSGVDVTIEQTAAVAKVATSQTTTSATFADLATTGPTVTATVPVSGRVKLTVASRMQNSGANQNFIGVDISGASTVAAATLMVSAGTTAVEYSRTTLLTGLTAGSTTFKMQYAVGAGTGTFLNRELIVEMVD